jgi:hypothetical protein
MNTILLTIAFLIDLIFQYECNEISSSPIFIRKSKIQFLYILKSLVIYYFKK